MKSNSKSYFCVTKLEKCLNATQSQQSNRKMLDNPVYTQKDKKTKRRKDKKSKRQKDNYVPKFSQISRTW